MGIVLLEYDPEADAYYFRLSEEPVTKTVEVSDVVMVDLDADHRIVGVEFLVAPARLPDDLNALTAAFPDLKEHVYEMERLSFSHC